MAADTVFINLRWQRNIQFRFPGFSSCFVIIWLLQQSICAAWQQHAYLYEQQRYLLPCSNSLYAARPNGSKLLFHNNQSTPWDLMADFAVASNEAQPFITIRTNDTSLDNIELICCQSDQWCPGSPASFRFTLTVMRSSSLKLRYRSPYVLETPLSSEIVIEVIYNFGLIISCSKNNIQLINSTLLEFISSMNQTTPMHTSATMRTITDWWNGTTFVCQNGTEFSLGYTFIAQYIVDVTINARIRAPNSNETIVWIDRDVLVVDRNSNVLLTCSAQCISTCYYSWSCSDTSQAGVTNMVNSSGISIDLRNSTCQCTVSTFNGSTYASSRRVSIVVTYIPRASFDLSINPSNEPSTIISIGCKGVEDGYPLIQSVCLFNQTETCTSRDTNPKSFTFVTNERSTQTLICSVDNAVGANTAMLATQSVGYISCNDAAPMNNTFDCLDGIVSSLSCGKQNADPTLIYQWYLNASLLNTTFKSEAINLNQNTTWNFLCVIRKDAIPINIMAWWIPNERNFSITINENRLSLSYESLTNPTTQTGHTTAAPSILVIAVPSAVAGLLLLIIIIVIAVVRKKRNQKVPPTYVSGALSISDIANAQAQGDAPYCEFGGVTSNDYTPVNKETKKHEINAQSTTSPKSESESGDVETHFSIYAQPESIKRRTQRTSAQPQPSQPDESKTPIPEQPNEATQMDPENSLYAKPIQHQSVQNS